MCKEGRGALGAVSSLSSLGSSVGAPDGSLCCMSPGRFVSPFGFSVLEPQSAELGGVETVRPSGGHSAPPVRHTCRESLKSCCTRANWGSEGLVTCSKAG